MDKFICYIFRWARWEETVDKNQLRKGWTIPVIEDCARIIVSLFQLSNPIFLIFLRNRCVL